MFLVIVGISRFVYERGYNQGIYVGGLIEKSAHPIYYSYLEAIKDNKGMKMPETRGKKK